MKRIFALILVFAIALSLVSCTSDSTIETSEPLLQNTSETVVLEEEPETVKAAVFWYNYADAFLKTVRDALNIELYTLGIEYENYDAQLDQAKQNEQIDTAISQGANLLIVNIVDTAAVDAAQNIVDMAKAEDIPVIFFNREVDDSVINSYENACFVGTRAAEAGEAQGIMIGQYIIENYDTIDINKDGYISYIHFVGESYYHDANIDVNLEDHPNYTTSISAQTNEITYLMQLEEPKIILLCSPPDTRSAGTIAYCNSLLTMSGHPSLVFYDDNNEYKALPTYWRKDEAFNQMEATLSTNPMDGDAPIELVIATNDDAALGCIQALNNVGYNTGDDKFIPVFGVDYTAEAQAAIEAGKMTGSILQSAEGMAQTIAVLVKNVMNGKNVFDDAVDIFNVDKGVAKIRVPYEIKAT